MRVYLAVFQLAVFQLAVFQLAAFRSVPGVNLALERAVPERC
jgi:hypothetical protein